MVDFRFFNGGTIEFNVKTDLVAPVTNGQRFTIMTFKETGSADLVRPRINIGQSYTVPDFLALAVALNCSLKYFIEGAPGVAGQVTLR